MLRLPVSGAVDCLQQTSCSYRQTSVPALGSHFGNHGQKCGMTFKTNLRRIQLQSTICMADKGFGSKSTTKQNKKPTGGLRKGQSPGTDWTKLKFRLQDFPADRPTKPIILVDGSAIMLFKVGGDVYCTDAASTAFKFPLTDAKIVERKTGPAIEVALDGTIYDLATGDVLEWCPKNNPVRVLLGNLKAKSNPEKLRVFPARVADGGDIYVKFGPAE